MNKDNRGMTSKNYDDMSREELVSIIGKDVDPMMDRSELVAMAKEADQRR